MLPQVIFINDTPGSSKKYSIEKQAQLPKAKLANIAAGSVSLHDGLFRDRRELTKSYVLRLQTLDILQNHLLEAGVRIDKPYQNLHLGWEQPSCQLRGHFAGHWLSAAAKFASIDHDAVLMARTTEAISILNQCQEMNGGQWVGSIPEKYFKILADGKLIWSPQYTVHKTMAGLLDAFLLTKNKTALSILEQAAAWFMDWSEKLVEEGHGDVVYRGECSGMLELWADLYALTADERYLTLASRYAMPDLFLKLLDGTDPLSNNHANASIPWIQGAARLYEVTGDERYRQIVEEFWNQAVLTRGMFATTGNNAGEYWIPPRQFSRYLGSRTQEHCTVYNMIRVAQYLLRWTGEAQYADYIERALYNGILAQQNHATGAVCYFLPLVPGAKKVWGSETHDFWCCHGTLVQAQAMYEDLIYYTADDGITVSQFIPSQLTVGDADERICITQTLSAEDKTATLSRVVDYDSFNIQLNITSEQAKPWTLRIRQPGWAGTLNKVTIDGVLVHSSVSHDGFIEITREWKAALVNISFPKQITRESLPGDNQRFALLDGPVVLAALSENEPALAKDAEITPQYEHQYVAGGEWQSAHYLIDTKNGTVAFKPLYDVTDERYCVYSKSID